MRQGLDVSDVEKRTKIRAKYLRALENEEFGMLPGSTFVKTFLRTYAEMLGLDPHPLVDEYRARHETVDEAEPASLGPTAAATRRERERRGVPGPPGPGAIVLLALVAVIVLLLVLGLTGGDDGGDGDRARTATTRSERTETQTERARPRPAPTSVTLRLTPTVPTYACVDTGEGSDILFEGTLDGARTFKGKRLRVNLGKTSVRLRVNGRPVRIQEGPSPAGFEFTPRGRKELALGKRPCA